jgi:glutamine amidotransferase/cyclase
LQLAQVCEKLGAGEILLNCIDKDGTNSGFDIELVNHISENVSIPVIAYSGAGKVEHFSEVFEKTDVEAALAAGIFHREEVPIEAAIEHHPSKRKWRNLATEYDKSTLQREKNDRRCGHDD